ncbi:cystathionine beta-lyase [Pseudomonas atacamensis]|uniref:Cystathionine beta-lyase n=1 Tax=Pseudomonas atacamensis TaxID=2565368 RepID=A0AAQ2D7R5_9PSED|nr:cystathionine beta-lyase [Pseudomonas atacamensis]THF25789.1 cystathionine beta-lyase [Pseudomonas atacamensis]
MKHKDSIHAISTQLTKLGRNPDMQHGFVNTPIYRGSTVVFNTVDDLENSRAKYIYGTLGTPTIESLETAWSEISGAAGTVLSPSGLGALALALLTTLKSGDHLLMTDSAYRPTRTFCSTLLEKFGVEVSYYDPLIAEKIVDLIRPNTSTILLESPGSQSFEIQDVPAITKIARAHNIKTIIDNTWATPLFFRAHDHGCDLSVEAGTKYLGGHSDLLMGLVTANAETWPALRQTYDSMSMLPGAEDCFLALRGMRTMHLRIKEAERRGLEIAQWLLEQPEVKQVLHPAIPSCPGHDIWKRDFKGSTGLFSFILHPEFEKPALEAMLDNMSLFSMGYSWGGFESLIIPFDCSEYRTVTTWAPGGLALRIQIGLEDMDELKIDLRLGLDRLNRWAHS